MKYIKYLTASALLIVGVVSCDSLTGDPDLPIPLEETLDNTGAFLRVLSVESAAFDVADPTNSFYGFTGEVSDVDQGQSIDRVDFYVSYTSADQSESVDEPDSPIASYSVDNDFEIREFSGLPSRSFVLDFPDVLDYLGLTLDDVSVADNFDIRWEVITEDGRTFTNDDASPAITGGFYISPYFARASAVVAIPENLFVGDYEFTQDAPSSDIAGAFANGWLWEGAQTFEAELSVNPDNTLVGRIFTATPLAEYGVAAQTYQTEFIVTDITGGTSRVTLSTDVTTGLACSALGIFYGYADGGEFTFDGSTSPYTFDDSQFSLAVTENTQGDCGLPGEVITFTVVKL